MMDDMEMMVKISNMVNEYYEEYDGDTAKGILQCSLGPIVACIIHELIERGKIKLC